MQNSVITEGKTTNEAIEKGLAILKVNKDMVEIKVLETEEKRSFFSILAPRIVKVELTIKEGVKGKKEEKSSPKLERKEEKQLDEKDNEVKEIINKIDVFLDEFFSKIDVKISKKIEIKYNYVYVSIHGENLNFLIGYRGETLNAIQTILSAIATRISKEKIRVLLDIENYRDKRTKALEELAEKIAKTVCKTKKSVTLEPMTAYERRIIHGQLQNHPQVKTYSTGNEPYRKVVVTLK